MWVRVLLASASAGIYPPAPPGSLRSPCVLLWSTDERRGVTTSAVLDLTLQVCRLRMPRDAGEPGSLGTWPPLRDPRAACWLPPTWGARVRSQGEAGLCPPLLPERLVIRRHLASHRFDALPGTNYFSDACRLPVPLNVSSSQRIRSKDDSHPLWLSLQRHWIRGG